MDNKLIEVTKKLMSFKTYKDNQEEFKKLFDYIKDEYNNLNIEEHEFNKKKCMVVSNQKTKKFDLLFCCHCDVVNTENWNITEDKDNIYGRGSIDMKGGLACSLEALKNANTKKKIGLFITTDEEIDGYTCKKILEIYNTRFAIIPDGGKNFQFITEEKGLLQLELIMKTHSAHASQPWNGENAIDKLYEVYQKLLKKYPLPKSSKEYITSINLGSINGGNSFNSVPDYCSMKLDIRYTSETNKEQLLKEIREISKDVEIKVALETSNFIANTEDKNVKKYQEITEKILNRKIERIGCESSSDAVYFYEKNIPTIIMNPIGDYPHGEKEYVNKESLYKLYEIYSEMIKEVKEC